MILTDHNHLLMIEPRGAPTPPAIDDLTRQAAAMLAVATPGNRYRGWHQCTGKGCTATSDNADWHVGGVTTNSLAVHYVACHRSEIPPGEFHKLLRLGLPVEGVEPTAKQIADGGGL